ncbi:MAG: hypothetical protein HT579_12335 [Candidatus Accumulibacter similis]|nr:MAG: hypothetical protein HT579_12335 [Candidatus Accumulibacter similis]
MRSDDAHKLLAREIDPGEQRRVGEDTSKVVARRWYTFKRHRWWRALQSR